MFLDRADAGERLTRALRDYRAAPRAVVLGLTRGGVVVASQVSRRLGIALDVFISRRLMAPWDETAALGAVTETGDVVLNDAACACGDLPSEILAHKVQEELLEIERQKELFRGGKPLAPVGGKTVLLVDDCIVTGDTLFAAVQALRKRSPRRIVAAIPVGSMAHIARLTSLADEVMVLEVPEQFHSPSRHYRSFKSVPDAEILELLKSSAEELAAHGPSAGA